MKGGEGNTKGREGATKGRKRKIRPLAKAPEALEAVVSRPPGSVSWPPRNDDEWIATSPDVQRTLAITRYSLHRSPGFIYDYTLSFTNIVRYNYYFIDESGDEYCVNTFNTGNHSFNFNSKKPTIVFIRVE